MRLAAHFFVIAVVSLVLGVHVSAAVDVPPKQILIEATIVRVVLNKDAKQEPGSSILDRIENLKTTDKKDAPSKKTGPTEQTPGDKPANAAGGLPAKYNGLAVRSIDGDAKEFVHSLEKFGETKMLACPRILVLNKQKAKFSIGDQEEGQTADKSKADPPPTENLSSDWTSLQLRPVVSSDGKIRMEIQWEQGVRKPDSSGLRNVEVESVTVNVMIPDGSTLVLGGKQTDVVVQDWSGFSLASRLPYIGHLFRHTAESVEKQELLLILTPRVLRPEELSDSKTLALAHEENRGKE
jgi:general secretion pathway protein D